MALYKVLKTGIRQRTGEGGWSVPKIGDVIKVSDVAAPRLIQKGFIAMTGSGASKTTEPVPESRRERRKKWLSSIGEESKVEAPEPVPTDKEGGTQ